MSRSPIRRVLTQILTTYIPLIIVLIVLLLPLYWVLITSFKGEVEIYSASRQAPLIIKQPTLINYQWLFTKIPYQRYFLNSAVVSLVTTFFSLLVSVMAGYAIAHLRFSGAAVIGILIFVTYLIPRTLLFIPVALVTQQLGVFGKFVSLILVYPTFAIPFCTWLLSGYFSTLPLEPEECAMVDGCTRVGAIARVTLPMAVPGILTAGVFAFTLSWNEFLYALVLVTGDLNRTVVLGVIAKFQTSDWAYLGPMMAAATLGSIPVALLFFFFMDLYVAGLTAGAVKG
ncbi:MAG: carbohydrate ABC transporter permease [Chloroflexi bacterium]|nr:carbohydrate ABC transporter permease [Chloroflexota bacterium]